MGCDYGVDQVTAWGDVKKRLTTEGLSAANCIHINKILGGCENKERLVRVVELAGDARRLGDVGRAVEERAQHEYTVLTSHRTMTILLAAGGVGLFCWYQKLPIVGASVVLAPLLYIGGAAVRYQFETQQGHRLVKLANEKIDELKEAIKKLKGENIGPGFSGDDIFQTSGDDFKPRPEDFPSLWGTVKPYATGLAELLAVVNLTSALLQVSGFRDLGYYLHVSRYVGITAIVSAAAVRGIYDREASTTYRVLHSVGTAGVAAILGGIVYQNWTGHTFGEWQWAWLVISRTEHLGYLGYEIFRRSAPIRDLWSLVVHHEKSQQPEVILDSLALTHSLISLIRPSLRYSNLLDYGTRAYLGLRLAEGVSGIFPVIWNHWGRHRYQQDYSVPEV